MMWNIENKLKSLLPAPRRFAEGGLAEADDMSRPFVGYRSAGRRPESQQDRRAAADAPLAALRGMVSGALGAPGDIESLIRMLPGLNERTVLPTSEDIEKRLPMRSVSQTPAGRAFTTGGQLGGGFYVGPGSPLRAIAGLPSAVSRAGRDFAMAAGQPAVNVVKPKGGNWLAGSVERAIEPMRQTVLNETGLQNLAERAGVDVSESVRARQLPEAAMNRWLDTKLGKYIRNEMATPEDPLRALAERGIMHSEITPTGYSLMVPRLSGGFPEEGMGVSPLAKAWEGRADSFVNKLMASDLTSQYPKMVEDNPWLLKVPPETRVYDMLRGADEDLGFSHLADELRNAITPSSGLPANLRLKYSDLEKVTVPQAVERVAKINDWRAAQKVEADMARAMGPATQVVKEYPEQGFKWVELRQPKEAVALSDDTLRAHMTERDMTPDEIDFALSDPQTRAQIEKMANEDYGPLADALKYEGETMGHCVGGYCPDVIEGRSRIYSLRDKKGQPHVTIEVAPRNITVEEAIKMARDEGLPEKGMETFNRVSEIMGSGDFMRQDIVQIKGKGNKAPKEEYLPAVQDFVRSGNFGKVGDLGNTGLIDVTQAGPLMKALQDIYGRDMKIGMDKFNAAADATPDAQRFMTKDELRNFLGETPPEGFSRGGQVRGYAAGGMVSGANFPTDDFDPDRIDSIVAELHAMNAV
jgi:hypothetical protein